MSRTDSLHELPEGLPIPTDDGACDHLPGMRLPPVALASGRIEKVFYPVFPPDENAEEVAGRLLHERS